MLKIICEKQLIVLWGMFIKTFWYILVSILSLLGPCLVISSCMMCPKFLLFRLNKRPYCRRSNRLRSKIFQLNTKGQITKYQIRVQIYKPIEQGVIMKKSSCLFKAQVEMEQMSKVKQQYSSLKSENLNINKKHADFLLCKLNSYVVLFVLRFFGSNGEN